MITDYKEIEYSCGDRVIVLVPKTEEEKNSFNAGFVEDMIANDCSVGVITHVGRVHSDGRRSYEVKFAHRGSWWWDPFYMRPAEDISDLEQYMNDFIKARLEIDMSKGSDQEIEELAGFMMDYGFPLSIEGWGETTSALKQWRTQFPALTTSNYHNMTLSANRLDAAQCKEERITIAKFLEKVREEQQTFITEEDFESILG